MPAAALTGVSGSGLISLNAANLSSGTVPDARLSTNVALRSGGNTFGGDQVFNNNVGIGATTLYNRLDLNPNAVIGNSTVVTDQHDAANRGTKVSFGYNIPAPGFPDEFNGMRAMVVGPRNCGNAGQLGFFTWQCGLASSREVMRINGAGNVGIGTSNPLFPLQVRAGVNQNLVIEPGASVGVPGAVSIRGVNDANTANIPVAVFGTQISLLGGNVGIGTTTPRYPLDVSGVGAAATLLSGGNVTSHSQQGVTWGGDSLEVGRGTSLYPENDLPDIYNEWIPKSELLSFQNAVVRIWQGNYPTPGRVSRKSRLENWGNAGVVRFGP